MPANDPPPAEPKDPPVPEILQDVKFAPDLFAGGGGVAFTNLLIVLALVLILLTGASLFNEALEETFSHVKGAGASAGLGAILIGAVPALGFLRAAWGAILHFFAFIVPGSSRADSWLPPIVLLGLTALIYSFLEPGFGLNEQSVVIFVSLAVSKGVLTLFYEGGKAWLYRRNLRVRAGLRLFPECILIALVSVVLSRVGDFQPGFVVGFVAAVVLLEKPQFSESQQGRAYFTIGAALLGVSVVAWVAAWGLHDIMSGNGGVWAALPESVAVSIFVVCLEGLLFSLIPLDFMDGHRVWRWNKIAWFALFIPTAFLFAQVLFNDQDAYLDLVTRSQSVTSMVILGGYVVVTFGTWAYLKRRATRAGVEPAEA